MPCIYLLVTGLLAWRKLLWDTKPASTHPLTTKLKSNAYFKAGDFENAIKDFTSAVPESIMSYGGKQKVMLRLHWATFSLRPYHVLKIQERGEDGVKMKQFRISKFPLRPYYVPATFLLRPHHVLTTSFTFPLRPQYALTKFIPFPLRPCYVLTKTKQFIPRANYVSSTF